MSDIPNGDTMCMEKNCKSRSDFVGERYKKCGMLNLIQHIDIHGKFCSTYHENRRKYCEIGSLAVTSITSNSSSFMGDVQKAVSSDKENKLVTFTVATKVSSLYPGHDIMSKKAQKKKLGNRNNATVA